MQQIRIAAILLITSLTAGCASIVGNTTEEPISDSPGVRTVGTILDDELIENKVLINLAQASQALKKSHISAVSFNESVLLVGQVPTLEAKQQATEVTQAVRDVKIVHNELQIAGPTSLLIRSNDTYLTSRAKVNLLASQNANGIRVKVITENGTVYLMGLVKRHEAQAAVDEIKSIAGVRKIVKVFEYID